MCTESTQNVHRMNTEWTLIVYRMRTVCAQNVHSMHADCAQTVHRMLTGCTSQFAVCFPAIPEHFLCRFSQLLSRPSAFFDSAGCVCTMVAFASRLRTGGGVVDVDIILPLRPVHNSGVIDLDPDDVVPWSFFRPLVRVHPSAFVSTVLIFGWLRLWEVFAVTAASRRSWAEMVPFHAYCRAALLSRYPEARPLRVYCAECLEQLHELQSQEF